MKYALKKADSGGKSVHIILTEQEAKLMRDLVGGSVPNRITFEAGTTVQERIQFFGKLFAALEACVKEPVDSGS